MDNDRIYNKLPLSIADQIYRLLWNRKLNATPMLAIRLRGAWIGNAQSVDSNRLYAVLCVIAYWLDSMGYKQEFKNELFSLLRKYPSVDVARKYIQNIGGFEKFAEWGLF